MKYTTDIQAAVNNPDQLEDLYQLSRQANEEAEFRADLQEVFEKSPDNLLLSAWHARFAHLPIPKSKRSTNWGLAVVLGIVTGLLLWSISEHRPALPGSNSILNPPLGSYCDHPSIIFHGDHFQKELSLYNDIRSWSYHCLCLCFTTCSGIEPIS